MNARRKNVAQNWSRLDLWIGIGRADCSSQDRVLASQRGAAANWS